jgi:hypothetical protein
MRTVQVADAKAKTETGRADGVEVLNAAMLRLDKEVGGRRMQVFPDSALRLN